MADKIDILRSIGHLPEGVIRRGERIYKQRISLFHLVKRIRQVIDRIDEFSAERIAVKLMHRFCGGLRRCAMATACICVGEDDMLRGFFDRCVFHMSKLANLCSNKVKTV